MRVVSWVVVVVSVGWLLAFNLGSSFTVALPEVSVEHVSGTVARGDRSLQHYEDFASRYTEAWNSHEPARVAEFFTPDVRFTINGGEPYVGREGVARMVQEYLAEVPDLVTVMEGLDSEGGRVVYHWSVIGTHAGTGNPVDISGTEVWRFDDGGLIAESVEAFDQAEYQRQVQHTSP